MAESQSVEERVVSAFMQADAEPVSQQANPAPGAAEVKGAEAPQAEQPEQQQPEVEAAAEEQPAEVETIEIDPDEPLFEQEIPDDTGKKVAQKLSLKELQQGYLRERDYRKKTQELARQREELPKVLAKQAQEVTQSYTKRLAELQGVVLKTVAEELAGKDLNKLATEDPFEYVRVSNRARQLNELLQTIKGETEAAARQREEQEKKAAAEKWAKSREILERDIPDFGPSVAKRLMDVAVEFGFTREEAAELNDHRIIKMAHALAERKTVESKRPEVEKKVAVVTKTLKPGQPTKPSNKLQEARQKLRKSGKPEDALSIFEAML